MYRRPPATRRLSDTAPTDGRLAVGAVSSAVGTDTATGGSPVNALREAELDLLQLGVGCPVRIHLGRTDHLGALGRDDPLYLLRLGGSGRGLVPHGGTARRLPDLESIATQRLDLQVVVAQAGEVVVRVGERIVDLAAALRRLDCRATAADHYRGEAGSQRQLRGGHRLTRQRLIPDVIGLVALSGPLAKAGRVVDPAVVP